MYCSMVRQPVSRTSDVRNQGERISSSAATARATNCCGLARDRFVAVAGTSSCGKSSLVRAGIVARAAQRLHDRCRIELKSGRPRRHDERRKSLGGVYPLCQVSCCSEERSAEGRTRREATASGRCDPRPGGGGGVAAIPRRCSIMAALIMPISGPLDQFLNLIFGSRGSPRNDHR